MKHALALRKCFYKHLWQESMNFPGKTKIAVEVMKLWNQSPKDIPSFKIKKPDTDNMLIKDLKI